GARRRQRRHGRVLALGGGERLDRRHLSPRPVGERRRDLRDGRERPPPLGVEDRPGPRTFRRSEVDPALADLPRPAADRLDHFHSPALLPNQSTLPAPPPPMPTTPDLPPP